MVLLFLCYSTTETQANRQILLTMHVGLSNNRGDKFNCHIKWNKVTILNVMKFFLLICI